VTILSSFGFAFSLRKLDTKKINKDLTPIDKNFIDLSLIALSRNGQTQIKKGLAKRSVFQAFPQYVNEVKRKNPAA
jgi:hypothetical protein